MSEMKYVRVFTGSDGETHFEDVVVWFTSSASAPPAPPVAASDWQSAERIRFLNFPPGYHADAHPAPRRQALVWLGGSMAGQTSDGEIRHFHAGDVLLAEDTGGKGHSNWNEGDDGVLAAVIHLSD